MLAARTTPEQDSNKAWQKSEQIAKTIRVSPAKKE
jgi:hypothetical protein